MQNAPLLEDSSFDDTGRVLRQARRLRQFSVLTAVVVVVVFSVSVEHVAQMRLGVVAARAIEICILSSALLLVTTPLSRMLRKSVIEFHEGRERWRSDAMRDPVTGLFNRRHFDERLSEEVARTRRHGNPLSLLVLDIDYFKSINDRYGHPAGDLTLREVAARLRSTFRREDVLARIGGDEMAAILPDTTIENAFEKAQRLRDSLAGTPFSSVGADGALRVTVSCGVCMVTADALDPEAMLQCADRSLYLAKTRRNAVAAIQLP